MRTAKGRGVVRIHPECCTGCGVCVIACRVGCLEFAPALNARGDLPVRYSGSGCLGDGACARVCPVPGALEIRLDLAPSPTWIGAVEPA